MLLEVYVISFLVCSPILANAAIIFPEIVHVSPLTQSVTTSYYLHHFIAGIIIAITIR